MRKAQKQEILNFIDSLRQAHEEIREALIQKNYGLAQNMLSECQEFAVTLGENIERLEGEEHVTVSFVEEYCETLFHVYQDLTNQPVNENKKYKVLRKQLLKVENSVKNDIITRKEVVFFPYKASMWDSLESVYLAAQEDPECDAYCVPIPYYDMNPDHSFGQMHYEGRDYPEEIEVIDWTTYNLEERKPDVIYIHNPYDEWNHVTSVHPRYYSSNLKNYTDTLVYIPYYSTSGGMNEAQSLCPAYLYADYIVIQSPKFREYFDKSIPDKKFLPFGSPKFDRVIRKCQNPPTPPARWLERMQGKKVYFYNTSINGMLANTEVFLEKMKYVFTCFQGRDDACLLWRPHPLLEATFDSMRPQYRPVYDALKQVFVDYNLGIYDDTPDVTDSVALSDAYIGDAGSSLTSLFGIAGKPIFILNNKIHSEPGEDSWRDEINIRFDIFNGEEDKYVIARGDKLYISEPYQYQYKYFCDLSEYACGGYYSLIYEIAGKRYACPANAQNILVLGKNGVEKKIELDKKTGKHGSFVTAWKYDRYLLLIPLMYPAIVRYDTVLNEIKYFDKNIEVFIKEIDGQNAIGGFYLYQGVLYIASPVDNLIYKLHVESGEIQVVELPIKSRCGCNCMVEHEGDLWLLPYDGKVIVRWNPYTGEAKEYTGFPEGFVCIHSKYQNECEKLPFCMPAFYGDYMYLSPCSANMYLRLNVNTGEFEKWLPSFEENAENINSAFFWARQKDKDSDFKIYSYTKKKLYRINLKTNECNEIEIRFDKEEMKNQEPGFSKHSEKIKYICTENAFNPLVNFLDDKIVGAQFDKKNQLEAYKEIASNNDGSCGEKIHKFVKDLQV